MMNLNTISLPWQAPPTNTKHEQLSKLLGTSSHLLAREIFCSPSGFGHDITDYQDRVELPIIDH
jgi:hypothetical protein